MLISFLKNAGPDSQGLGGDTLANSGAAVAVVGPRTTQNSKARGRLRSIFALGLEQRLTELLNWVSTLRALAVHQTQDHPPAENKQRWKI